MKFLNKFKLGFGITTLVMGAGLTSLSGGLLGAGVNKETFISKKEGNVTINVGFGVGNLNFGKTSIEYVRDNKIISASSAGAEAQAKAEATRKEFVPVADEIEDTSKISKNAFVKKAEEVNKNQQKIIDTTINEPSYQEALKQKQNALTEAKNKMANANITTPEYLTASTALATAEQELATLQLPVTTAQSIINQNDALLDAINSADALMISGSVLLPIFVIVTGLGIAITTIAAINKKKQQTTQE